MALFSVHYGKSLTKIDCAKFMKYPDITLKNEKSDQNIPPYKEIITMIKTQMKLKKR